jgi:phosphoglycerate dehydrogenase-like enzyme
MTSSLTRETRGLIGEKELRMMRRDAYIVNVARGAIINERVLYQAVSGGWIAGAGLDVLELEPPSKDNPLLRLKNCIITPHIAGLTTERYSDCGRVAVEEVKKVLGGAAPKLENLVNPEVLKKENSTE